MNVAYWMAALAGVLVGAASRMVELRRRDQRRAAKRAARKRGDG